MIFLPQTLSFISPTAAIIIAVVGLILFGSKRLPEFGRSIGVSLKEFKDGMNGVVMTEDKEKKQIDHEEEKKSKED
ncbi:Sec-independent protein translocase subunit TatA/TatB [Aliicoccus persicus]|uniref:Sec-independent protein translocase protein TatA n=1 Tax=Aliicoccus persicus TaxID=930138 RepID=A0A662Z480_9STAP|nr:twin-arginine translocase TatA/TatE family subunit [Aliicoccus persicus]SEW10439.1 sec-independent protein translocase protein TatA [Aliicoccus persicus]HJE18802.1 twin-arginine translocase TatA/TatE family subunit [Aliicoccus persicus]